MRMPASTVAWLLPLLLAGCIPKARVAQNQPLAPAIIDPMPTPVPSPTNLPPPEITIPTPPAAPDTKPKQPAPAPKPPRHRKPANTNTEQASNASPTVSAIGQLSSGDPPNLRQQTDGLIQSTERSLNGINRKLSDQETKTAMQIREFLKQARAALSSGDVDGAHILALKSQVLLDELLK